MVAIMGPSGCGKTTLLNCLSGLDRFDAGDVLIEGVSLAAMSDRARTDHRARRMGFVFQFYNLIPVLTAAENVELPLLVAGVSSKERATAGASPRWRWWGWTDGRTTLPEELSGGERQRVTIARSLVNEPALVWADEPTGDLDSEKAAEVVELMRSLNVERGLTFVIVTHDIAVGPGNGSHRPHARRRVVDEELPGGDAMFARTTLLEIDTVRVPLADALATFEDEVMPRLRQQPGFRGVYVLTTPDGRALLHHVLGVRRGGRRRRRPGGTRMCSPSTRRCSARRPGESTTRCASPSRRS